VSVDHEKYISRCFELARRAGRDTLSNPQVGAVLVYKGRIIGEGFHKKFGGPHAEVNCLASVKEADKSFISEATLYVSLEPCCIVSKTPACTDAIIRANIPKVVISVTDPDSRVSGRSRGILEQEGIEVITDILTEEGLRLISPFRAHLAQRPHVILKWAQSADGYLGKRGKQVWLSNKHSKIKTHQWRSEVDAILVGRGTVLVDDPELTTRLVPGSDPLRVVLGRTLAGMEGSKVLQDEKPTLFALTGPKLEGWDYHNKEQLAIAMDASGSPIEALLKALFERGVHNLMVEGGAQVHKSFVKSGLWDEARIINTRRVLISGIRAAKVSGELFREEKLDDDVISYISV